MAAKEDELYERILEMAPDVDEKFLELGSSLSRLQDLDRDLFWKAIEKGKLGKRKAYYLIAISKAFKDIKVGKPRLRKIGWTRLQVIARIINESNAEDLLNFAELHKVKDLEAIIKGEEPNPDSRVMILYFSPEQYEKVEGCLVKHGASRHGRGLVAKETALMKVVEKADG